MFTMSQVKGDKHEKQQKLQESQLIRINYLEFLDVVR
jgi:hypothetical protein